MIWKDNWFTSFTTNTDGEPCWDFDVDSSEGSDPGGSLDDLLFQVVNPANGKIRTVTTV